MWCVSQFVLCSLRNPQPVATDEFISYTVTGGREVELPHPGPTGVGASSKPEDRPERHSRYPAEYVPVRPSTCEKWLTVQSDGTKILLMELVS